MRGKSFNKIFGLLMIVSLMISFAAMAVTFAMPVRVFVNPPEGTAAVGEYYHVDIEVEDATNLNLFEFFISYDAGVLSLAEADVTEGPFLSDVGPTSFEAVVFTAFGYAQVGCSLMIAAGATGSGVLASLDFLVVGNPPGVSDLDLYDTTLKDIDFVDITHDVEDGYFFIETPVAYFTVTPSDPIPYETAVFDASASFSPVGAEIVQYEWDFGDGSPAVATGGDWVTHFFTDYREEPYHVTLTVTDEFDRTGSTTNDVYIWRDVAVTNIWTTWDLGTMLDYWVYYEWIVAPDYSHDYIDWGQVNQMGEPFLWIQPSIINFGSQTESFTVTTTVLNADGDPVGTVQPAADPYGTEQTLAPEEGTLYYCNFIWYWLDEEGHCLPPGDYTIHCNITSVIPGETKTENNGWVNDFTINPPSRGIFWEGDGLPEGDTNECYLPLGIIKQTYPVDTMGMKWNLTFTNVGTENFTSGNLRLAVYAKEEAPGPGITPGMPLTGDVAYRISLSPYSGWSMWYGSETAIHECFWGEFYEKEDYQVKMKIWALPLPINVGDTVNVYMHTVWPTRNMSAVKLQAAIWNDTNGDWIIDLDEWPLLSEADIPLEIDFHAYGTTQIAGTGKFWSDPPIQAAHDAATAGDQIFVYTGDYPENVNVNKNNLTFTGLPYHGKPKVIGQPHTTGDGDCFAVWGNYTTIEVFRFTSFSDPWAGVGIYWNTTGTTIQDCEIYSDYPTDTLGSSRGIQSVQMGPCLDITIQRNDIHNCRTGIVMNKGFDHGLIYNNEIYLCRMGIQGTGFNYNKIKCNDIHNNTKGIDMDDWFTDPVGNEINKNNFYFNSQFAITVWTVDTIPTVNAKANWYGNETGPTHASNPLGNGDTVSDHVDFTPWLAAPVPFPLCEPLVYAPVIKVDPPLVHKWVCDGGAKCDSFEVDIVIANITEPKMYGFQFNLTYEYCLINLTDYVIKLDEIFGESCYYYEVKMGPGWFFLTATAEDPECGFSGTGVLVTLTFHICETHCYICPYEWSTDLLLTDVKVCDWGDEVENPKLFPVGVFSGKFTLSACRPKLHLQGRQWQTDHIINITGPNAKECTEFTVDVWLLNASKIYDYWFILTWNSTLISLKDYTIERCLLEGPWEAVYIEEGHVDELEGYWWYNDLIDEWFFMPYCTDWLSVYVEAKCWTPSAMGDGILMTLTFHLEDFMEQGFVWKKHEDIHVNTWIEFFCTFWGLSYKCHLGPGDIPFWDIDINNVKVDVYPVPGDVNCDGKVNGLDLALISCHFGICSPANELYDINGDGVVDILDLTEAAKRITI